MRQNEHLPLPETLSTAHTKKVPAALRLTAADAERMEAQRYEMLEVVEEYLSAPFQKILREKIGQEKEKLLVFVAQEQRVQDAAQRIVRVLNPAYFVHKPLDKTMFE
jgi:hypothetical protein